MFKAILIILATLLVLGYFFMQWANKPENVEALLKAREQEKKQAIADSIKAEKDKEQQRLDKAVDAWKDVEVQKKNEADLQLVIDETFQNNRLEDMDMQKTSTTKITDKELIYSTTVYKKTTSETILALSKKEFENFVAEMETEIAGDELGVGIVFNYKKVRKKTLFGTMETWNSDRVSSSMQSVSLTVNNEDETENLVTLKEVLTFKSIPKQKVRLEKKGKQLKVSVNGKIIFDKAVNQYSYSKGKVGIYTATSNSTNWNQSVIGTIKSFKVWTW